MCAWAAARRAGGLPGVVSAANWAGHSCQQLIQGRRAVAAAHCSCRKNAKEQNSTGESVIPGLTRRKHKSKDTHSTGAASGRSLRLQRTAATWTRLPAKCRFRASVMPPAEPSWQMVCCGQEQTHFTGRPLLPHLQLSRPAGSVLGADQLPCAQEQRLVIHRRRAELGRRDRRGIALAVRINDLQWRHSLMTAAALVSGHHAPDAGQLAVGT